MSHVYKTNLHWKRTTPDFTYDTYDRAHEITFGGGSKVAASSAPEFLGKAELVNPEEMFAASLSSCHMLTFLAIAAKSRFVVDSYEDSAVAEMSPGKNGKLAVTKVVLRPKVSFGGETKPDAEKLKKMHEKSHENCFIANSVNCEVIVEG